MSQYFIYLLVTAINLLLIGNNVKTEESIAAPKKGLIAYYPFNGNANDESGNGHHGTLFNGARIVGDKNGKPQSALSLDGTNGVIVENGSPLVPTNELTISFDIMLRSQGKRQVYVSAINWNSGTGFGYFVSSSRPQDNKTVFGLARKGARCNRFYTESADLSVGPVLEEECWYTMVVSFNRGKLKMYINGELVSVDKAPFSRINSCDNTNFIIGNWWSQDPVGLDGKIDNVRIYNRQLTPAEIEHSGHWYL